MGNSPSTGHGGEPGEGIHDSRDIAVDEIVDKRPPEDKQNVPKSNNNAEPAISDTLHAQKLQFIGHIFVADS